LIIDRVDLDGEVASYGIAAGELHFDRSLGLSSRVRDHPYERRFPFDRGGDAKRGGFPREVVGLKCEPHSAGPAGSIAKTAGARQETQKERSRASHRPGAVTVLAAIAATTVNATKINEPRVTFQI
jgi:hypothetical protein